MTPAITLDQRRISADDPCYIIAEIGVNHNGKLNLAHDLIDEAKKTGADAVKFQTYKTDALVLPSAIQADYQTENMGKAQKQADMLRQFELPFDAFTELRDHCGDVGIDFLSTAFDAESLDFVISLDPVCLKWASGELTNMPLLKQASRSRLPLLLSTGMGSIGEIDEAVSWLDDQMPLVILQCVSAYPAAIEDQNLRTLETLRSRFNCPTGFSDHTIGPYAALAARSLGMAVLEKHFTLDKRNIGPDHSASIEPDEFRHLIEVLRAVEAGLGDGVKRPQMHENNVSTVARKSLVYRRDLPVGHVLTADDLTAKRPAAGLPPAEMAMMMGRTLNVAVQGNTLVRRHDVT